jgi:hypothetical protein
MQVQPVQQVQTSYYRTAYGWTGLSLIEMGNNQVLRIITDEHGLASCATCHTRENGILAFRFGTRGNGDYSETLAVSQPPRITEARVNSQHGRVLENLQTILARVEQFYARQATQGA